MSEATDRKVQKAKADVLKRDKIAAEYTIRRIMSEPEMRRWMWNFLSDAGIWSNTINFGESGHAVTAFREGKRAIGLRVLADIMRLTPTLYLTMTQEMANVRTKLRNPDPSAEPESEPDDTDSDDSDVS